jgi:hypothetical protein
MSTSDSDGNGDVTRGADLEAGMQVRREVLGAEHLDR